MPDALMKIIISRCLLNMLKDKPHLKAVCTPGVKEQRITRLIGSADDDRVFEMDISSCLNSSMRHSGKAIVSFGVDDIRHIQKTRALLLESRSLSTLQSADLYVSSTVYFTGEREDELLKHDAVRITPKYVQLCFSNSASGEKMISDIIWIGLLSGKSPGERLLGLEELLTSDRVFVIVDEKGDRPNLKSVTRERIKPDEMLITDDFYVTLDKNGAIIGMSAELRERWGLTDTVIFSEDNEHAEFTLNIWRKTVSRQDTLLGYNDWVHRHIEIAGQSAPAMRYSQSLLS